MKYMKKKQPMGCIVMACILLLNGSEWEGSIWEGNAVVAANGDLPVEGLYVATNVFPRNTVVYITNLETEKTIPVTVAASLDNPGLLITLTREAAEAIGMPIGSLGRIKMIQPADPEAFSKYLAQVAQNKGNVPSDEALQKSARGAGTTENVLPEKPAPAPESPPAIGSASPVPEDTSRKDAIDIPDAYKPGTPSELRVDEEPNPDPEFLVLHAAEPGAPGTDHPEVTLFPETTEDPRLTINEKPEERLEQPETYWPGIGSTTGPEPRTGIEEAAGNDVGEGMAVNLPKETAIPPEVNPPETFPLSSSDTESLTIQEKPILAESLVTPETHLPLQIPSTAKEDRALKIPETPSTEEVANPEGREVAEGPRYTGDAYNLRLTPAEERPPTEREIAGLPAEAEIAPIVHPAQNDQRINPSFIINSITYPVADSQADRELAPFIPPIPESSRSAEFPLKFSVPVISRLEKGKYYLQLGAYHQAELVEPELSKIGSSYPLTIQHSGNPDRPLYRILLGPMNLGESGALLQRFRSIGYHDAFLRLGT
ncbi:MAG: SPOR domain-containing protein [Treponema sp.]|nr:SPOR domain-containing protein [Treponema sp.]